MKRICMVVLVCGVACWLRADLGIKESKYYQQEGSSLRFFSGSVDLPAQGVWGVATNNEVLYTIPPAETFRRQNSRRMAEVELEKKLAYGNFPLCTLSWKCREYANNHDNRGPASVDDFELPENQSLIKSLTTSPWYGIPKEVDNDGPFFFLVPNAEFRFIDGEKSVRRENRNVLAVELRPYVDDGRHWVCYTDGSCIREKIDQEMMARHGQRIRPIFAEAPTPDLSSATYSYPLFAYVPEGAESDVLPVVLENSYTKETTTVVWDLSKAEPGDKTLASSVSQHRSAIWARYLSVSDSPVLQAWLALAGDGRMARALRNQRGQRRQGETTSAFGVLGGFAAVRETLQMQLINPVDAVQERTVPVGSVVGVEVKSHPYDELLGDQEGGTLALANLAPQDHFFVYLAKPEALLPMLDSGAGFISELGGTLAGNRIKYDLKRRYLARLGMDEAWLERFLKSGGVKECALFAPDLFLLDGTDITVVTRMSNARLVIPLLKAVGVPTLSDQKISELENKEGHKTYWTLRDDLLLLGTSKEELQLVLDLHAKDGAGSLGKSPEFRYMLTRLPAIDLTRCYAYCSDSFIRHLVSPATKIGQLRRVDAINTLTLLTSGALLAELDGFGKVQSVDILKERGHLPATFDEGDEYWLDSDLVAHSTAYGTLANLTPIGSIPVEMVTEQEAEAYEAYVQNYSRLWRQFFDPIAFRLDDAPDGAYEASIFILPLIDSSIYNGIKQYVTDREDGAPLKIPVFSPDPVLRLSVNLNDTAWRWVARRLPDMLRSVHVNLAILDDLGPGLHLLVNDSDPVVTFGSGDLLGAFGGNTQAWGRNGQMLLIPALLSFLTRPCTLAVETDEPDKTIQYLRNASGSLRNDANGIQSEIYQIDGRDSWVCVFDIMGMVRLRIGLEVRDGYLLIRSVPWSNDAHVMSVANADLNGVELKVEPAASRLQLAGLYASAKEHERQTTLKGIGLLYPLLASGDATMDTAFDRHMKLFGFTPYQASGDQWSWKNGTVESEQLGTSYRTRQSAYAEGDDDFGLMGSIQDLSLQLQFEETGLRTVIHWKTREK